MFVEMTARICLHRPRQTASQQRKQLLTFAPLARFDRKEPGLNWGQYLTKDARILGANAMSSFGTQGGRRRGCILLIFFSYADEFTCRQT